MSDLVTAGELAAALDSLILAEQQKELQDDEITAARIIKRTGWNDYRVRKVIEEWVQAGYVEYVGKKREPLRGAMVDAWKMKG
jgi:hypothetical protein